MGKEFQEKWLCELIDIWTSSGLIGKILLVFSCIGASTTLTSLSGVIVEWRGLIAEMLLFYSQYIRNPIATFVSFVTFDILQLSRTFIDAALLYVIYFSAEKRVIGKLNERSALNSSLFIMFVIVLPVVIVTILLLVLYLADRYLVTGLWSYAGTISTMIPLVLILLSLYQWVRSLIWLGKGNFPEGLNPESHSAYYKYQIKQFVLFSTPIVFAFIMLAVLASINSSFA